MVLGITTLWQRIPRLVKIVAAVVLVGLLAVVAVSLVTGRSLDVRSRVTASARAVWRTVKAVADSQRVRGFSQGQYTNVIFLHHSVGQNLVDQGMVRQQLTKAGSNFWDQGYNDWALRGPDGNAQSYLYTVPGDNTDPDGLAGIFTQPAYPLPLNTLSGLLQHEVIVFKSCYPVSNIVDDQQLARYKAYYLTIRDTIDQHPDKLFIALTPPPLNPAETNVAVAARARQFANWLKSDEFTQGLPNLVIFDLFAYLASDDPASPDFNMPRAAYRDGTDSHPNRVANEKIGPLFADFVVKSSESYRAARSK